MLAKGAGIGESTGLDRIWVVCGLGVISKKLVMAKGGWYCCDGTKLDRTEGGCGY